MTDEERVAEQTSDERMANARLAALGANRECPICRTHKWSIAEVEGAPTTLFVSPLLGFDVHDFFCERCGYVQQFLRETLDAMPLPSTELESG